VPLGPPDRFNRWPVSWCRGPDLADSAPGRNPSNLHQSGNAPDTENQVVVCERLAPQSPRFLHLLRDAAVDRRGFGRFAAPPAGEEGAYVVEVGVDDEDDDQGQSSTVSKSRSITLSHF
jgi:hypothetical protein